MSFLRVPQNWQSPYDVTSLITHLGKASTTLCACFYAVSPVDASVVAMTSYSSNLTALPGYPGATFKRNTGVIASQMQSESGSAFSQMEATMFLAVAGISEADVTAGKWAHAPAVLFVCNYEALNMGQLIMQSGYLGEFTQKSPALVAEIKGLNNALTAQVGTVTRAECSHDFCDAGCTLIEADYTQLITLDSVTSQVVVSDSSLVSLYPADYFNNGKLVGVSGNNANYTMRIDAYDTALGKFTLRTPTPYLARTGDTFNAVAGCQKRLTDCQNRLQIDGVTAVNNVINRKAFDFVPTIESFVRLPASFSV